MRPLSSATRSSTSTPVATISIASDLMTPLTKLGPMGGALTYRSGWLLDRFGMGAAFYTAQRLYGPKDRDGTLLLKPGQHGYSVVGQIYGKVKLFDDQFLNLYRYEDNTPFINKNDSRMTPNTFQGYTLQVT